MKTLEKSKQMKPAGNIKKTAGKIASAVFSGFLLASSTLSCAPEMYNLSIFAGKTNEIKLRRGVTLVVYEQKKEKIKITARAIRVTEKGTKFDIKIDNGNQRDCFHLYLGNGEKIKFYIVYSNSKYGRTRDSEIIMINPKRERPPRSRYGLIESTVVVPIETSLELKGTASDKRSVTVSLSR